jgi:hypothetical protein
MPAVLSAAGWLYLGQGWDQLMRTAVIVALSILLTGCVSPTRHDDSFSSIDFSRYKSIAYTVTTTPDTEYGDNDSGYGQQTIDLFRTLLGQRLEGMSYDVVPANADLNLDIVVNAVKPGSGAARFWVGFGAGRAVLTYTATFTDRDRKIAGFDGGESYTGMEIGKSFAGLDEIKTFAALAGAKQVETFMLNGGRFPDDKRKKAGNPNSR